MADIVRMPHPLVQATRHVEHRNLLLAALSAAELSRLSRHLVAISTYKRQVLQRAGDPIRYVYFPVDGVFSLTAAFPEGAVAETAAIGHEGMLGIEAFFHADARALGDIIVQVEGGVVERLDVQLFWRELAERGRFHTIVGHYAEYLLAQTMQAAVCHALHKVDERVAKRLLLADDHLDRRSEVRLSHEALALVLGTRRQTVTGIARRFQRAGLITYKHARVTLLDRDGLEKASCSCYRMMRERMTRLFTGL